MSLAAVRRATTDDAHAVIALYRELRPHDPALSADRIPELWRAVAESHGSRILVADVNDTIAATCMLVFLANLASSGRPIGVIEHVITSASLRRQGIGRQLLEFALKEAWQADCCKVILLSGAQRIEAHRVYEAVGFRGDVERGYVARPPESTVP
jgi:GNAT superfamily N-acetyltransferase